MTNRTNSAARLRALLLGAALIGSVSLAACGTTDDEADSTTTTAAATTTTTGGTSSTKPSGGGDYPGSTGSSDATEADWTLDPQEHRGEDGEQFTYDCSPEGAPSTIWGTETYTDDSSVCTAAVHVGLITLAEGGEVTIEIAPGEAQYQGAVGNGITSNRYGSWEGSFTFPEAPPGSGSFTVGPESWARTATDIAGDVGTQAEVECSASGTPGSVWGTDTYTADSSICTAAVHAGLIEVAKGGTVRIELAEGLDSYEGSTANGVTTSSYGAYDSSFTFAEGAAAN